MMFLNTLPSFSEICHYWRVARNFYPWQEEFWLALFHDLVEDGYLGLHWLERWEALDCITRREGEVYLHDYINRVMVNEVATNVKIRDLFDNIARGHKGKMMLLQRYLIALAKITDHKHQLDVLKRTHA